MSEMDYSNGRNMALVGMLNHCLRELGDAAPDGARLLAERAQAVVVLRKLCEEFGDNDWPEDLFLPDVIEKHLRPYLADTESE